MNIVCFRISGRFGHFLRAEANASAPSYPLPPRTALLGLMGAVLGLEKDEPQSLLEPAHVAIAGQLSQTHWHTAKLRKDPPATLPRSMKRGQGGSSTTKPEKATLIAQEWLFNPSFLVWASLPEPFQNELSLRLESRRWYFQPCLGITEHLADLSFVSSLKGSKIPAGTHEIDSVFPRSAGEVDVDIIFERKLVIQALRLPRQITADRVFGHADYFMERNARPVPVKTAEAVQAGKKKIIFM